MLLTMEQELKTMCSGMEMRKWNTSLLTIDTTKNTSAIAVYVLQLLYRGTLGSLISGMLGGGRYGSPPSHLNELTNPSAEMNKNCASVKKLPALGSIWMINSKKMLFKMHPTSTLNTPPTAPFNIAIPLLPLLVNFVWEFGQDKSIFPLQKKKCPFFLDSFFLDFFLAFC